MVAWGELDSPPCPDENGWLYLLAEKFRGVDLQDALRSSYECEPEYLCVPLAVSDHCLAGYWKLDCFARKAVTAANLRELVSPAKLEFAKLVWERTKILIRGHGLRIGNGKLLLISDYH